MRVSLEQIPAHGVKFSADHNESWAMEAAAEILEARPQTLSFAVNLRRTRLGVEAKGSVACTYPTRCARCGRDIIQSLDETFEGQFAHEATTIADDGSVAWEELDVSFFENESIMLNAVLGENLALATPARIRCDTVGATRQEPDDSPCQLPQQDALPEFERRSPFADLALPE